MCNSQLNTLKSGIKNGTEITSNPSPNVIVDFNDGNNFRHKLLLTDTPVPKIRKVFANGSSSNIKLSSLRSYI